MKVYHPLPECLNLKVTPADYEAGKCLVYHTVDSEVQIRSIDHVAIKVVPDGRPLDYALAFMDSAGNFGFIGLTPNLPNNSIITWTHGKTIEAGVSRWLKRIGKIVAGFLRESEREDAIDEAEAEYGGKA